MINDCKNYGYAILLRIQEQCNCGTLLAVTNNIYSFTSTSKMIFSDLNLAADVSLQGYITSNHLY